jgi:hypothetical protein
MMRRYVKRWRANKFAAVEHSYAKSLILLTRKRFDGLHRHQTRQRQILPLSANQQARRPKSKDLQHLSRPSNGGHQPASDNGI